MTAGWAVPDLTPVWRTCDLCGATSDDEREVHPAMWPTRDGGWTSGARCFGRVGCRERVEAKGGTWTVDDGTSATPATSKAPTADRSDRQTP